MYETKFTGAGYEATKRLDIAEIAKRVRTGLRNAQALGGLPAEMKFSVRIDRYAGGQSLRVDLSGMPDSWTYVSPGLEPDYRNNVPTHGGHSDAAKSALATAEEIREAHNYDASDAQIDYFNVRYYGNTVIVDERSAAWRAAEKSKQAARKAARKSV